MIKNYNHAKTHATKYLDKDTVVVSESGDIFANCNVDKVVADLKKEKKNYFIVKGELTKK